MKALGWIIGLVALIIVAIGAYVLLNSGALLQRAIETYGSRYLGAPVNVSQVNVSLADSSATVDGLVIGNPAGFSGPPALRLNSVHVTLNTSELSSELVSLEDVSIDGAEVTALAQGTKTNLQVLMDNLNARIASSEEAEDTGVESEVKLIIDRFDFTSAHATLSSDVLGETAVNVPDIHLTDIGRASNGATVGQVLKQVLEPVVRAVTRKLVEQGVNLGGVGEKLKQDARNRANDAMHGGLDRLKGALRPKSGTSEQPRDQQ